METDVPVFKDENYDELSEKSHADADGHLLTPYERAYFSEYFCKRINNGFLLSEYSQPSQIELNALFYNGAGIAYTKYDLDEEEINAYLKAINAERTYLDLIKLTSKQIDDLLKDKMGISYEDVSYKLGWIYLEDYDSYYAEVGDTIYSTLYCVDGYKTEGGVYTLHCVNPFSDGQPVDECVVTMQKTEEGKYLFVSNEVVES
jgi:hypothetical protein